MFELSEEHRMLKDLVAKFVDRELMPLEPAVLAREAQGQKVGLTDEEEARLHARCKELGLWGLDVPAELGGANLPVVALMGMNEELGRTPVPFYFPPDSPNLHMLMAAANPEQRRLYLDPYARGEAKSAIAISEPGAGGDPAAMITRAVKDGGDWVINGRKIWISRVPYADFTIVMARTGEGKRHEGITAFIVEKGTPGFHIEREIPMLGGQRTYEVLLEDCRVPEAQMLGRLGQGFAPMQLRLTIRRLQMGAWCTGMAVRALDMLCSHARQRSTFGVRLADRQAVQWWIAEAATKIHACRLMVLDAAAKQDAGQDVRTEASMVKVFATEMAQDVIDHAMQAYGAMGMTKELPLQLMMQKVRTMRVYEGPSEVHRMVIARRVLDSRR
ncbi:acyl-CoA dehydrogenase family protein [Limobrevibacterium gyesilva]|uniref:Acyl-CoA dehydrogenase n=1 Tax=Limobrevibacterium gyesilva TaxID=2991712 RepID=A0AA41YJJ2_9PROT|nr:acyl-CoA dehydrogenase [Limobrevibacterium gyesilva]MCW3473242.1 acyl-CoA dehydrogenase [Limobrevibacterium gyesilva]